MRFRYLFFGWYGLQFILAPLAEAKPESFLFGQEDSLRLVVNNRVLAKVNGKAFSVMDIMKKMDMLFYRQFPEYTSSVQARYQFYLVNWKHFLQESIDKELILADADEAKMPVSSGDVRQEIENLFGPNIIVNLDKIGLSYEEAYEMVRADIIIRRMIFVRVNSKALKKITPQNIRQAYEQFAKENVRPDEWHYQVISIREKDATNGAEIANLAYQYLSENIPLSELSEKLKSHPLYQESTSINISDENHHNEKEMSKAYFDALSKLSDNTFSPPIPQKSRSDKSTVFRLFYLKEMKKGGVPPLSEVENKLKEQIVDKEVNIETENYLKKLRQHFDVQENYLKQMIAEDFQPFSLQ